MIVVLALLACIAGHVPTDTGDTGIKPDSSCVETAWYPDVDADGWGYQKPGELPAAIWACDPPSGYARDGVDCAPLDAQIHPGAAEVRGDGIDQDCDGQD